MSKPVAQVMLWLSGKNPPYSADDPAPREHCRNVIEQVLRDRPGYDSDTVRQTLQSYLIATRSSPDGTYFEISTPPFSDLAGLKRQQEIIKRLNEDPRTSLDEIKIGVYASKSPYTQNLMRGYVYFQPLFEPNPAPELLRRNLFNTLFLFNCKQWLKEQGCEVGFDIREATYMVMAQPRNRRSIGEWQIESKKATYMVLPSRPDPKDPYAIETDVRKAHLLGLCLLRDLRNDPGALREISNRFNDIPNYISMELDFYGNESNARTLRKPIEKRAPAPVISIASPPQRTPDKNVK